MNGLHLAALPKGSRSPACLSDPLSERAPSATCGARLNLRISAGNCESAADCSCDDAEVLASPRVHQKGNETVALRRLMAGAALMAATTVVAIAQAPPRDNRPTPVPRVQSLDDILPTSEAERALARFLDTPEQSKLRPGINLDVRPLSTRPLLRAPPEYRMPTGDEAIAAGLCRSSMALASVQASRVVTNASRSLLLTVYRLRVHEWVRGNHDPEAYIAVVGGRVFISGQEYVTPTNPRSRAASVQIGTSYIFSLITIGSGAYRLVEDPIATTGTAVLDGRTESLADTHSRLRRIIAEHCPDRQDGAAQER